MPHGVAMRAVCERGVLHTLMQTYPASPWHAQSTRIRGGSSRFGGIKFEPVNQWGTKLAETRGCKSKMPASRSPTAVVARHGQHLPASAGVSGLERSQH